MLEVMYMADAAHATAVTKMRAMEWECVWFTWGTVKGHNSPYIFLFHNLHEHISSSRAEKKWYTFLCTNGSYRQGYWLVVSSTSLSKYSKSGGIIQPFPAWNMNNVEHTPFS